MDHGGSVVVLCGGSNSERRVSVASAQNVLAAWPRAEAWFLAPDGAVHRDARGAVLAQQRPFETDLVPPGMPTWRTLDDALATPRGSGRVVFTGCLHGSGVEDGALQEQLERHGWPYTGAGVEASRLAFDKEAARRCVSAAGIRVAEAVELPAHLDGARMAVRDMLARHGRVVVKPRADGSSVGLHHVRGPADVELAAADVASRVGVPFLCEAFVPGREFTVGVVEWPDGRVQALPPTEPIVVEGGAFDYQGKYLGRGVREVTPPDAPPDLVSAAQALALRAHEVTGCRGYSRTDIIMAEGGPVFLEINTLPGLTRASFIPQQLAAAGIAFVDFLDAQVAVARARFLAASADG